MKAKKKKNPNAVALGRLGGKVSGPLKPVQELSAMGKKGSETRWKDHEYSKKYNSEYQRLRRERLKREKEEREQ